MTLATKIALFAKLPQTQVTLRRMTEFGSVPSQATLINATQFLRDELPIRLAHRVVELDNLPHGLSSMPSVLKVREMYTQSFRDLMEFPHPSDARVPHDFVVVENGKLVKSYYNPTTSSCVIPASVNEYNQNFRKCLEKIKRRHDPVVTTIAQGILEMKREWSKTSPTKNPTINTPLPLSIQSFLDRFYMSRIGIRMLIGQHVAISKAALDPTSTPQDYVGIICTKTPVIEVAKDAAENAKFICQEYYGLWGGPNVRIIGGENLDERFSYVPSHLHHMLFELLKNSLRACVERYGVDADVYPDIKMVFAEGKEDITVKISDEGGGIPRSGMPLIWSYMYTTAENPLLEDNFNKSDFKAPLAGFGYGLPLSRLYARYFGGDLRLISMEGFGTDAYLHLSKLSDSEEPLIN